MKDLSVIFMGTPDFAVPCLKALIENCNVVGVFTQTDKPAHRKQVLTPPPVKVVAQENNIPVFQYNTIKSNEAFEKIKNLNPDIIIVVAYGKILPKEILTFPKYGCINIHGSLLPKYRGAAPIQWSVMSGEEYAGVTSMYMDEGLDTGDILIKEKTKIMPDETSEDLFERLSVLGKDVMLATIEGILSGTVVREKQDNEQATYAPILDKKMAIIDWNDTAQNIHNKIRGLNPWPIAETFLHDKKLKIFKSSVIKGTNANSGEVVESSKRLVVSCGDGNALEIHELQLEGKKKMMTQAFLSGFSIEKDLILGR